jgi:acetyltransferase, GNAT family
MDNQNLNKSYSNREIFMLIALAYVFGVVCRLFYVAWAGGIEQFYFNGEIMVNTNDAFANAEGARDMLAGFHQTHDMSPYGGSISTFTFLLAKILPVKFESIIFYMSVFLAPLIAAPLILIAREYKILSAGVAAAFIASILPAYYGRTLAGYYDGDMLNVTFPMLIIWALIRLADKKDENFALAPIITVFYDWWYQSSYALNSAIIVMFLLYTLVFDRKNLVSYKAIILMLFAVINFDAYYEGEDLVVNYVLILKLGLICGIYALMKIKPQIFGAKTLALLATIAIALFAAFGGVDPILNRLLFYFTGSTSTQAPTLHFFDTRSTIVELMGTSFNKFATTASGNTLTLLLSVVGAVLLLIKFRSFLLIAPILGLGALSFTGGVRFIMYAAPVLAFGFGYFVYFMLNTVQIRAWLRNIAFATFVSLVLFPSFSYILQYRPAPLVVSKAVQALDELKSRVNRDDYALSWWDYGYLIRYYADVKTLSDPGAQSGEDSFPVSFSLIKDQTASANMARLNTEYVKMRFDKKFDENVTSTLIQMQKDYGEPDVNKFLASLDDKNFKLPQKTTDVYYVLFSQIVDMLPQIVKFSEIDLTTGKSLGTPLFYMGLPFSEGATNIDIGNEFILPSMTPEFVAIKGKPAPVNSYHYVQSRDGKLDTKSVTVDENAKICVVFLADYNRILLLDKKLFDSTFIQLFLFENYDKELFEPVILDPTVKIYKLLK